MFSAVVDSLLIEGYPTVVRFHRIWFPLKTHSLRKYIKKLFILIRILHVDKLTLLLTIFMNTIPINLNMDLFSVEGQYVFASVTDFNLLTIDIFKWRYYLNCHSLLCSLECSLPGTTSFSSLGNSQYLKASSKCSQM